MLIKVFRVGDQKILELVESVRRYLPEAEARLPDGLSLTVWRDDSQYLRDRLDVLLSNGLLGFALVFCLLAVFLRLLARSAEELDHLAIKGRDVIRLAAGDEVAVRPCRPGIIKRESGFERENLLCWG